MPGLTRQTDALNRAVIPVRLGVDEFARRAAVERGLAPPPPIELAALIDTGCTDLAVNRASVRPLALRRTGAKRILTAAGEVIVPRCSLVLAIDLAPDLAFERRLDASVHDLPERLGVDVLLGRAVLEHATAIFDFGQRRFSLWFD